MRSMDPYKQGMDAYWMEQRLKDCPYQEGSRERENWVSGFKRAMGGTPNRSVYGQHNP